MTLQSVTTTDLITVEPETDGRDAAGGKDPTYGTAVIKRCAIQPMTSDEIELHRQKGHSTTHKLFFSTDPGIRNSDRITHNGTKLYARGNPQDVASKGRLWVVFAEELQHRQGL